MEKEIDIKDRIKELNDLTEDLKQLAAEMMVEWARQNLEKRQLSYSERITKGMEKK